MRAAAFHLGVLEKLWSLGLMDRVDVLSTVSGGAITGATYMLHKASFEQFKSCMLANFKRSLERHTVLSWRFAATLCVPTYTTTDVLAATFAKLYYGSVVMSDLPREPKFIINSTNLSTGKNWKISQERMGDWKTGYDGRVSELALATAVAAATAVPGIFKPVRLKANRYFNTLEYEVRTIGLADGGLYDNQGIHALTSGYGGFSRCTSVICSDASFPFDDTRRHPPFRSISVLRRASNIMMDRIKNMQFQNLLYGQHRSSVKSAYFSIDWTIPRLVKALRGQEELARFLGVWNDISNVSASHMNSLEHGSMEFKDIIGLVKRITGFAELEDYLTDTEVEQISRIGTRLKALSETEIELLARHGSSLCGFQVRSYLPHLLSATDDSTDLSQGAN